MLLRARGSKVARKVNVTLEARYQRWLTRLLLLFPATVVKIEGRYDVVIRDYEVEGTVPHRGQFLPSLHKTNKTNFLPSFKHHRVSVGSYMTENNNLFTQILTLNYRGEKNSPKP